MTIEEIIGSKRKPKEKVTLLAEKLKSDKKLAAELIERFETASAPEKGSCMEAMLQGNSQIKSLRRSQNF
jgi:predicted nuclease of restriction endonuclease-like RecB superfamily